MNVALVTVGDELLAGETVNTNGAWLAEQLTDRGCRIERLTTLPDRIRDIAKVVNEYRAAYDAVVVTGGLGPTHDDMTMAAVATAVGRDLEHHAEAEAWLSEERGYSADDLDEGTTDLPAGARMLPNEVGVAPGAVVDSIYVLPGVPSEMKAMFESVADEFAGDRRSRFLYTVEPESNIVPALEESMQRFDVAVGCYPDREADHNRLKVTATDDDALDAAATWLLEHVDASETPVSRDW